MIHTEEYSRAVIKAREEGLVSRVKTIRVVGKVRQLRYNPYNVSIGNAMEIDKSGDNNNNDKNTKNNLAAAARTTTTTASRIPEAAREHCIGAQSVGLLLFGAAPRSVCRGIPAANDAMGFRGYHRERRTRKRRNEPRAVADPGHGDAAPGRCSPRH